MIIEEGISYQVQRFDSASGAWLIIVQSGLTGEDHAIRVMNALKEGNPNGEYRVQKIRTVKETIL